MARRFVIVGLLALLVAPATASAAKSRWYYLYDRPMVKSVSAYPGRADIDGRVYLRSILTTVCSGCFHYAEYNLKRRCSRLTFTAGITDDQDSESVAQYTVYGGGSPLDMFTIPFGQSVTKTIKVKRVLRLKLEATSVSENQFYAAWGNPKIRCKRLR